MLTRAHVLPISDEDRARLVSLRKGDSVELNLLLESGDETAVVVEVSATDVSERVIRIEGAATHEGSRVKVIAQVLNGSKTRSIAGYAELISSPTAPA